MELYSYKEIQAIIKRHSADELVELANQYVHHDRNRKIFLTRMLDHIPIEELSVQFDITARRCSDIIKESSTIVFSHMDL